jgi:hypothetical protein
MLTSLMILSIDYIAWLCHSHLIEWL